MDANQFILKEWKEKRKTILLRDHFTCLNCHTFNPSLGMVGIYRIDDSSLEFHKYESSPGDSLYMLHSQKFGITLEIDFGLDWLVLPVMQIHHKRYIENRQAWEYDDSDLVTLCKSCHTFFHDRHEIPLFDSNLNFIKNKKYPPEDYGSGHNHNYKPWVFINFNDKREYVVTDIKPVFRLLISANEIEREEEIEKNARILYHDFFERFLPDYTH